MNNPHILYIDDEFINLELFKLSFQKDFNVTLAESGKEALEILQEENSIEIILTDLNMPFMNGQMFINEALKLGIETPIFILSGYDMDTDTQEMLNKGIISGYFTKPFDRKLITDTFKSTLNIIA